MHKREGGTVTYQCNDGYRPSLSFISTCTEDAMWMPDPEEHNCTLVVGMLAHFV